MRRAIEKLTFLLLSFAVASLVSFALLARMADRGRPDRPALPLLINLNPRDARDLTLLAVKDAAGSGPSAEQGRAELARLGGAALPHVLPFLETLEPTARGRVALALSPIAFRMGVASDEELSSPERAAVFFTRFWQDRGADFRAQVVRRKVQRLAERSLALRRKEVLELDTFALAELLEALGRVQGPEDVKRVERLSPVLSHATGVVVPLPPNPSVAQAAHVVTAWREWGFDHGSDFVTLDGPGRLAATVLQTRYFRFLASVPRTLANDDPTGAARLRRVLELGRVSLPLVLLSVALAVALCTAFARWHARSPARRSTTWRIASGLSALPLAGLVVQGASGAFATVVVLSVGLAALLLVELDRFERGRHRLQRVIQRAGMLLPLALSAGLAAEAVQGRGLGALAQRALAARDLETLVWIAWLLSATGCLAVLVPDAAPRAGDVDESPGTDLAPGRRRKPILLAAGGLFALFALGGLLHSALPGSLGPLAAALGRTLVVALTVTVVAAAVTVVLGLLAGGISPAADTFLARAGELRGALPEPLIACSLFGFGGMLGPAVLGVLRGIEVAQVLRSRLAEQRAFEAVEPPSLGRAPLSPYLRRVLPPTIAPVATTLALSGAWIATLEGASATLSAPVASSLATLSTTPGASGVLALLGIGLLVGAACWLVREISPHEQSIETPGVPVLALKRRIDSVRPSAPNAGSEPPVEP